MTEFTVHVTRSSQANDLCFQVPFDIPSGTTILGPVSGTADIRGAMSDHIVRLDASGILAEETIEAEEWQESFSGPPNTLLRAEIIAEAAQQPIRRALGSPVHIEGIHN
ncbi:hypothetical protein FHT82_002831 [Rhizobium sp. BK275]|jgi:hypothetical protein|uniref:hypothetical protein n=1 Tax=unclassified Rhizobium TaxID=2613769 RepID=UPI001618CEF0|nr:MULTISPECIES: hypothetical protein [unclassified Rhizobium]MBB3390068.1 hypothetical protein [Rhizobium sp. BK275]MBB3409469.1 hypothetical protein [Rhizobium sp. BK316]